MATIRFGWFGVAVALVSMGLAAGCADVPVHNVSKTFAIEVSEVSESKDKIELDFLWVIDSSASMSQEQLALSKAFENFVDELGKYLPNMDVRLAVTTMDGITNCGKFNNKPAETFLPGAFENVVMACLGDEDCQKVLGQGWRCEAPSAAAKLYSLNGSINSKCVFGCKSDGDCCGQFCYEDECGSSQSCLLTRCADAPNDECVIGCRAPGGTVESSGCLMPPDTEDCPASIPAVLTNNTLDLFKCIATVQPGQSVSESLEMGLLTTWQALDPDGRNAEQARAFLRPDAYLVIVFVTDEDDCSIHEEFAAPSFTCETDEDCAGCQAKCKTDVFYSQLMGKKIKLCHGALKKDYYNSCSLLGEYKGEAHHDCAYDLGCRDCSSDEDCDYGWYCKDKKKCRPYFYAGSSFASFQNPPGAPLFSLTPVAEFYSKFRSLKADPAKVLVAVISGDGVPKGPAKTGSEPEGPSMITEACLKDSRLAACQAFKEARDAAAKECIADPAEEGCEDYYQAKLECIRECFIASKGDPKNPSGGKNSYVCLSDFGIADIGSRYHRLAAMFGPNGLASNICSEDGIVPSLQTIAELIIKRVTKICLPILPKSGESILVTLTIVHEDGTMAPPRLLAEGEPEDGGDYRIEFPTQECCFPDERGDCTGTLKAITFNEVLDPRARIEVRYEAQYGDPE